MPLTPDAPEADGVAELDGNVLMLDFAEVTGGTAAVAAQPHGGRQSTFESSLDLADLTAIGGSSIESSLDLREVATAVAAAAGDVCQPTLRLRSKDKGTRLRRFAQRAGREYCKHKAFRRDNRLVGAKGYWLLSKTLQQYDLPPMSHRMQDLLHIIWLLLERQGEDPSRVNQAWMLCQSIAREPRSRYPRGCLAGMRISIPGLHLGQQPARALAPCVLPCCRMWLNLRRRFALGAELLQLQGVHMPTACPSWKLERDSILKRIAGQGFAIPVMGWYALLAMAALAEGNASVAAAGTSAHRVAVAAALPTVSVAAAAAGSEHLPSAPVVAAAGASRQLLSFSFDALAAALVNTLLQDLPDCFSGSDKEITLGTLCSGGDFIVPMVQAIAAAVNQRASALRITVADIFGCEWDQDVWDVRVRAMPAPRFFYRDVLSLPLQEMPAVDLLVFGSSCKSLSRQNNKRRTLRDTDAADKLCSSGATMQSCLRYIAAKRPRIVIAENVVGMLDSTGIGQERNVDVVLDALRDCGYTCGFDVQCACDFFLPQTRKRVFVWAHRLGWDPAVFSSKIRGLKPKGNIPLEACLLE